jgi:glycerol-1-phosphate dehydrogenase [NAD(P)+]
MATQPDRKPWIATVDNRALERLADFCTEHGLTRFLLVADRNTWAAQGEAVAATLTAMGADLRTVVFRSDEVVADAEHVFQLLIAYDPDDGGERTLVAVGSGTITDITRFAAHRTRSDFISIPTAPSVDAYVSVGAPMIVNGVKVTYNILAPIAVFADVRTLAAAPRPMIAAGLGDMLAKFSSVADFRLAHLMRDELYDEVIGRRMLGTAQDAAAAVDALAKGSDEGIAALQQALYDSGWCMVDFSNSRPASGTEHHYSHYWEMMLLRQGRPAILHGAKTGYATILAAELWQAVRAMSRDEVSNLLEAAEQPDRDEDIATIYGVFGPLTDEVVETQRSFLDLTPSDYEAQKRRILDNWEKIQQIAEDVPSPERIAGWLQQVGGPTTIEALGLTEDEKAQAERYAHFLRDRFSVRKLLRVLGSHQPPPSATAD